MRHNAKSQGLGLSAVVAEGLHRTEPPTLGMGAGSSPWSGEKKQDTGAREGLGRKRLGFAA